MTTLELHPEELIDREASGVLTTVERDLLEAHSARCSACRLERLVRQDFADENRFAVVPHTGALVSRVLEQNDHSAFIHSVALKSRSRQVFIGLVAAALLASTLVAARTGILTSVFQTVVRKISMREEAPMAQRSFEAPPIARPVAEPVPSVIEATKWVPSDSPRVIVHKFAKVAAPSVGELYAQANRERREGRYAQAAQMYLKILKDHATDDEAAASRVALGRLRLDEGDCANALALFDEYLQSEEEALREEAMLGRAVALQQLNRTTLELSAWKSLLEKYPASVHAARARQRLDALDGN